MRTDSKAALQFTTKLEDACAAPLREMIHSFVAAFLLKSPKITDHRMVSNVLGAITHLIEP
jgi:hypothetical protein